MSRSPHRSPSNAGSFISDGEKSPRRNSSSSNVSGAPRFMDSVHPRSLEAATRPQLAAADEPLWPKEWRAYTCLLGCFFLMFNSWGLVNAYGTFSSYYLQHLLPGIDVLKLNLVGSTQSFVVLSLSFVIGRILDAGHSQLLIGTGSFFVTLGMFMLSVANGNGQYGQGKYGLIWLTQGFVTGLGMACFFVSSSQIAATWFIRKKGFAIGIVASGASIAGLIYPVMTKFLITEVGFNNAVRYVATVVCLTSVLAFFIATPRPTHIYRKPEKWMALKVWVDTQAFRNPAFCWFMAAICFLFFGFYAIFFNLEEWAASEGFGIKGDTPEGFEVDLQGEVPKDAIRTFWLLSIMNASSTLGRLGSAYLCDHFGALNVHMTVTLLASLLTLILWTLTSTLAAGIAFVVLFGIISGSVIGLPPASVAYILGPGPHQQAKLGQWTGMMYTSAAAFALTGPVIAGYLISRFGNYYTVQGWSGGCLFVSACCMGLARVYAKNGRGREFITERKRRLSDGTLSMLKTLTVEKKNTEEN